MNEPLNVNLKSKVALVIGAAQRIGLAIADSPAANGAHVVRTDREASPDGKVLALDVTNPGQVQTVIDGVVREHGRLDILVNNAGVNTAAHRVNIEQFPLAEWERILAVDLNGVFNVTRAGAAPMIKQNAGRIINIASVMGVVGARLQCDFTAAKAGVMNLTRSTAPQLQARIYGVFALKCSGYGGRVRLVGFITEPATVRQILEHVGGPNIAPAIAPARSPPQEMKIA